MLGKRMGEVLDVGAGRVASAVFLASSAFQTMTPSTQAVMTSAKAMTTTVERYPPQRPVRVWEISIGHCFALMAVPDLVGRQRAR